MTRRTATRAQKGASVAQLDRISNDCERPRASRRAIPKPLALLFGLGFALACRRPAEGEDASANSAGLRAAKRVPGHHDQPVAESLGASSPGLGHGAEGLWLAWMRDLGEPTLLVANLAEGEGWSEPVVVSSGPRLVVNWADVPAVAETPSGRLVVAWPELHTDDPAGGYGLRIAAANDDGSFSPDRQWSPDGVRRGPESGFASFIDTPEGLWLVWLDGRELGGHGGHGDDGHANGGAGTMQLRAARIDDDGQQLGPSTILDPRTCECCKLGAAAFRGRPLVAYRDRSEAEVRDVFVAGPGLPPRAVASDGWTLTGCPVNGPAVAAGPSQAWVGWYTGAEQRSATWIASTTITATVLDATSADVPAGDPPRRLITP